jgi:hypothetical protein
MVMCASARATAGAAAVADTSAAPTIKRLIQPPTPVFIPVK